ncbi:MAG TPA: metallophosphoesterase [Pyrinomonadaceae bacterium]|nr:metallophosphoesterase [Pyrinomonadaceae bacterium]
MTLAFVIAIAVLLGLLLFVFQQVRRPGGRSVWNKRVRVGLAAVLLFGASVVFWAFFIEPNRLIVRHETIQVNQLPPELDGLRIAVLSDIHVGGSFIDERKLQTIVERTNQLQPELIVICGDYIAGDGRRHEPKILPEVFAPILKNFKAPLGVYSVLGNHDWWYDGFRVRQALEQNGIKVLENEAFGVERNGTSFWIVGFADLWTRPQRILEAVAHAPQNAPLIAITHNPDIFPRLPHYVPLLLAGHTHGGQIRLPLIGPVVQPSRISENYARGHVIENGRHLFVTTGIGTSIIPVRFGVTPEIVLLTVKTRP